MTALDRDTLEQLASTVPAPRADRMRAAFDLFDKLDLPTGAEEEWRYVDLDLDLSSIPLATAPGMPMAPGAFLSAIGERAATAVIVDGHVTGVDAGSDVTVERLAESEDVVEGIVPDDLDVFAAARGAFGVDGVRVSVPAGAEPGGPVVLDVQATASQASFPTVLVEAGTNSEVSVVVVYRSPADVTALVSPLVSIDAADGARVRFVAVQDFGFSTTSIIHQRARLGRDASLRIGEVGLGGIVGRLDLGVLHEGDGSSSEVVGLYFGQGEQTLDYRLVLTHRGRNTGSDVFLKGAVEDHAESVFTGLLKIEKDATRTSAFETNRNLVLSEGAAAHSVPNLEILCDDVVCGHGSSVGPLEEDHVYYLQSRGLSRERAERLLIKGFFQEIIDRLPVPGLDGPVADEVFSRFVQAQEEGRVA